MKNIAKTLIINMILLASCGGEDDFEGFRPDDSQLFDLTFGVPDYLTQDNFVDFIDNPFFTLTPGTITVLEGENEDGEPVRVTEEVLSSKKIVMGIESTSVLVKEWENGELVEETEDWFAQDIEGNVWYMGEAVTDFENGKVAGHDGEWEGGVDGAIPGILMPAEPRVGMFYRQEFLPGEAEDLAEVLSLNETITVAFGTFDNVLKTKEWNPLEKDSEEYKYWAPGVGFLRAEGIGEPGFEDLVSIDK